MGCNSSKKQEEEQAAAAAAAEKKRKRDEANAAMNAPKLHPADFMLTKLKDQTIIKEPGSIKGQQFIIEECENCTIYILDHTATVSIDECKNCRIFVGPCESSVFIRTSKHLKLVIAAQQLRTRECSDLDILLYVSAGQPVIESTSGVRLGCFNFNYFGLAEQFKAAGLDPWYSEWSNVHDFTAASGQSPSWSFMDSSINGTDLLPPFAQLEDNKGLENLPGFVTPKTTGNRPLPMANPVRFLVAIAPGHHDEIGFDLLENKLAPIIQSGSLYLVRSRRVDFSKTPNKEKIPTIFSGPARKTYEKFVTHLGEKGGTLGFELACTQDSLPEVLAKIQESVDSHQGFVYVSDSSPSQQSKVVLEGFFENMAIM